MPKAQRHEKSVVNQPPMSGPKAAAAPMVEPHTAKAIPRSLPKKLALSSDNEVGSIIAPPKPWASRARMSADPPSAVAAKTLATTKTRTPRSNMRRRPMRSATRPKSSSVDANTSV